MQPGVTLMWEEAGEMRLRRGGSANAAQMLPPSFSHPVPVIIILSSSSFAEGLANALCSSAPKFLSAGATIERVIGRMREGGIGDHRLGH